MYEYKKDDVLRIYLEEIRGIPLLTIEEEKELCIKMKLGEQWAKDRLIQSNLRLVVSIAKHFAYPNGMLLADLIQDGNMGLLMAADKYDHTKGFRFSTYATWWIRHAITRGIENTGNSIRLPVHINKDIAKIRKIQKNFTVINGREPTEEELIDKAKTSRKNFQMIKLYLDDMISLDEVKQAGNEDVFYGVVNQSESFHRYNEIEDTMMKEELFRILDELSEKEKRVIILRYGLEGEEGKTQQQISDEIHMTRKSIRRIEQCALQKLKEKEEINELKEFFG